MFLILFRLYWNLCERCFFFSCWLRKDDSICRPLLCRLLLGLLLRIVFIARAYFFALSVFLATGSLRLRLFLFVSPFLFSYRALLCIFLFLCWMVWIFSFRSFISGTFPFIRMSIFAHLSLGVSSSISFWHVSIFHCPACGCILMCMKSLLMAFIVFLQ